MKDWLSLHWQKSYGFHNIKYKGPVCTKAVRVNNCVKLYFDQSLSTVDKKQPCGFEIGYKIPGTDSLLFAQSQAIIKGKKVIVWNEKVKVPLFIRYAWLEAGNANLSNKSNLPAFPFQKRVITAQ